MEGWGGEEGVGGRWIQGVEVSKIVSAREVATFEATIATASVKVLVLA